MNGLVDRANASCVTMPRDAYRRRWTVMAAALSVLLVLGGGQALAQCNDGDGDGYGSPGNANCPNGAATDCNDGNAAINPGATERCNGVDDNCAGGVDEGFTFFGVDIDVNSPTAGLEVNLPLGAECALGSGICRAFGTVVCAGDGLSAICNATPGAAQVEGPGDAANCFDNLDNDCDELIDHEDSDCTTPERCDGFDNDNDGEIDEDWPEIGMSCTVGIGVCQRTGAFFCAPSGTVTQCHVQPFPPGNESVPGGAVCRDGLDNDCDGFTDLDDPDCLEAEKCDGVDNDNNGEVDETFPDLGSACMSGLGACAVPGVKICSADGASTVCGAAAKLPSPEGPAGITCLDGIDNDCDGAVDSNDANCAATDLAVTCSLGPSICRDCMGWFTINFDVSGAAPEAEITAELIAYNEDGEVVGTIPVANGDVANLGAVTYREDCQVVRSVGGVHQVFAPLPLLKVTVRDPRATTEAFCSIIPYVDVIQPSGQTIAESSGDVMPVLAAIPSIDPKTLKVLIDGVDVFAGAGIDPATQFPGGPYNGNLMINGKSVTISDLIVDAAGPGVPSSNTLRMNVSSLGCGEHIVQVTGEKLAGSVKEPPATWCHQDDLLDRGSASGFSAEIFTPLVNEVTAGGPTHVTGEVCHGKPIAEVLANGLGLDTSTQVFTPGNGTTGGDLYVFDIDVMLPQTDLRALLNGNPQIGSFVQGSNLLIVQAIDEEFISTYADRQFSVGPVIPAPGPGARFSPLADDVIVSNAFTIGISKQGLDDFFESFTIVAREFIKDKLETQLNGYETTQRIDEDKLGCCDADIKMKIVSVDIDENDFLVTVTPMDNQILVELVLPEYFFEVTLKGKCCGFGGCGFFCTCARKIDMKVQMRQATTKVSFPITEAVVLGTEQLTVTFDPGTVEFGATLNDDNSASCGFTIFSILTLGIINLVELFIDIIIPDEFFKTIDVEEKVKELDGDFGDFSEFRFDNQEDLPDLDLVLDFALDEVEIDTEGIAASVMAKIIPTVLDPDAADVQGSPMTPAPLPRPPIVDTSGLPAKGITVGLSDDMLNQLLLGMTKTGQLKSTFVDRKEIQSFLTEDCDSLPDTFPLFRRARCIGRTNVDNDSICDTEYPAPILDAAKRTACKDEQEKYRQRLLIPGTAVHIVGKVLNPPKVFFDDDPATPNEVECIFRYDQISFALVADRDADTMTLNGDPNAVPACLGLDPSTVTECALWRSCLNVNAKMALTRGSIMRPDGKTVPSIAVLFDSLDYELATGTLCGGATTEADDLVQGTFELPLMDFIAEKLRENTPELATEGLSFGGHATFSIDAELISISVTGGEFADYLCITADIEPENP